MALTVFGPAVSTEDAWAAECPVGELCYQSTACGPDEIPYVGGDCLKINDFMIQKSKEDFVATKGDIDAINKRLDTMEHLLLLLCSNAMGAPCEIRR
jgi:hypothetical protein